MPSEKPPLKPALKPVSLAPPEVLREDLPDGGIVLRAKAPLAPHEGHLGQMLRRAAAAAPERTFLAERDGDGWRRLGYAEALAGAEAVGQALLDRGLGPDRPAMVLSGNSIDHARITLGAHLAGVPVAPVSTAYSLMSRDHAKLGHVFRLVRPALVFVEQPAPFAAALASLDLGGCELVASGAAPAPVPDRPAATPLADLLATRPGAALAAAEAALGPDTVAKYLFTSGSTGEPKGVINTHGMLAANQQMMAQVWPFLAARPPVLVDWLPWNHTFGGNYDFNLVLRHAGSLYIDPGRPMPGLIEGTVRALAEISPTVYFNVPAGFTQLLPYLESDANLRRRFFAELDLILYAGAALPQDLWDRLEAVSVAATGKRVLLTSAWGSTETSPLATSAHFPIPRAGVIGVPVPGVEIKMVPAGGKMELRVRGPSVTPGYLGRPDLTAAAFDEDGYYMIGDAGRLADPDDPAKGLVFDGRVAEDFKLLTGTWVSAGALRVQTLAAAPVLQDAVVAGHDRGHVGLLGWLNPAACTGLLAKPAPDDPAALARAPEVLAAVRDGLARHNADNPGSSTRIARLLLLEAPPSIDAGEITDKGYINQRAVLEARADLVDRLYAEPPDDGVIVL